MADQDCGHCHHGTRHGKQVGWSPTRLVWEPCASADRPIGPAVQPLTTYLQDRAAGGDRG